MENKELVKKIKEVMVLNSLKNKDVEEKLNLPKNSLSNFLSERKEFPKKFALPIESYLNCFNPEYTPEPLIKTNPVIAELLEEGIVKKGSDVEPKKYYLGRSSEAINSGEARIEEVTKEEYDIFWKTANKGSELIYIEDGKRLRDFCKQFKTDPDSVFSFLMDYWGNGTAKLSTGLKQGKKPEIQDLTQDKSVGTPYNPNTNPFWRKKMGLTEPKTK